MKQKRTLALIAFVMLLAACSDRDNPFGYGKSRPDEFNVRTNPPLILPPNYNLRPPGVGTRPVNLQGRELAKAIVLPAPASAEPDDAEDVFLARAARGMEAGDGIREEIENERRNTSARDPERVDGLVQTREPSRVQTKCRYIICL